MKILVVYDSYFGNTEKVAQAIGESIGDEVPVKRPDAVKLEELSEQDLLVVGSPTRAFRPSDSINEFLENIPSGELKGVKVAAFDTRIDPKDVGNPILSIMARLFGYAAKPIANKLVRKGGELVGEPLGIFVLDSEGPLREGELERSASWAEGLLA